MPELDFARAGAPAQVAAAFAARRARARAFHAAARAVARWAAGLGRPRGRALAAGCCPHPA
ncbi:hypothetical protein [Albimonas pacifica]|uniref:Uncharacterized protein n=1 Tax=Albimonas pacifica TaxID=1114924 RepID=A0A1I3D0N1_9RHOB|nr:hypothetical protein [Albimonas pacifica]SFH80277.1 hypothetical protein SAMN05216258_102318 [Albimonas pacifica]